MMATPESGPTEAYVAFVDHINDESVAVALSHLDGLAEEEIGRVVLAIQTKGGEINAGMRLYERLRAAPFQLVTHAVAEVSSMGIPLYLAGEVRRAGPQCQFSFHRPSITVEAEQALDVPALDELRAALEADEQRTRTVYEDRTPLAGAEIDALKATEAVLGAEEAVGHGIAHEVQPFALPPGQGLVMVGQPPSPTTP
jgi:ATP-dependent protease ClpP protease subunit